MQTASPLEIAWTSLTAVGLLASLMLLALATFDLSAVAAERLNGYRRRYARKLVREAIERTGVFVCLLSVGVVLLSAPPALARTNRKAGTLVGLILLVLTAWKTLHVLWTLCDEYFVRLRLWMEDRAWYRHGGRD